jgi:hypothetical protein
MQLLAYGVSYDSTKEYLRLAESTAIKCLYMFVQAVRACFEYRYLRKPTQSDILEQMDVNESRGWLGMFASLDCMYYKWKNCPVGLQGQYQNRDGDKSIILEAVVDYRGWIWHCYFRLSGSNNDLNVLDCSPLVHDMFRGVGMDLNYTVNGVTYPGYYLLADGIYPTWAIFVQTIADVQDEKQKHFSNVRRELERMLRELSGCSRVDFTMFVIRASNGTYRPLKTSCMHVSFLTIW